MRNTSLTINDLFSRDDFCLDFIKEARRGTERSVVFRFSGYQYEMPEYRFKEIMKAYKINTDEDLLHLRVRTFDNRPLYQKSIDMMCGKQVSFENMPHYPTVDEHRFKALLEKRIQKRKSEDKNNNYIEL
jgi:hypothetical protein